MLAGISAGDIAFNHVTQHIYLADQASNSILEVDLNGVLAGIYQTPGQSYQTPASLTVATDGSVWFSVLPTDQSPNFPSEIGRLDTSGNMTFSMIPNGGVIANSLTAGNDGSIWFVGQPLPAQDPETNLPYLPVGAEVGRAHFDTTSGSIIVDGVYAIDTPGSLPTGITVANNGSVWFSVANQGGMYAGDGPDRLVHGVLSGSTLVQTEYVIPEPAGLGGGPADLTLDSAGRLWFTQISSNQIGFMDTSSGDFTLMAIPSTAANPAGILATSSDVWATAIGGGDDVLRIDLSTFVAPLSATSPNIEATEGLAYTGLLATFFSAEGGTFTYTIDYGDGQTETGVITGAAGSYTINANVTYATAGTHDTSITISTEGGNVVKMLGTATITPENSNPDAVVGQGIDLSGSQNEALAGNRTINGEPVLAVATFSGGPAAYSALITWGDNTTTQGEIVALGGGMYAVVVSASKVYAAEGTYSGTVEISGGTNTLTVGFTAEISDAPLVASSGVQLETLKGRHVNGTVATFTDDINSEANWFIATINWGDGTTSSGVVVRDTANPGTYTVLGQHLYKGKKATYTVLTLITNTVEGGTVIASATITI
jgi:streptogramin lyase